jgi:hypothetical protein
VIHSFAHPLSHLAGDPFCTGIGRQLGHPDYHVNVTIRRVLMFRQPAAALAHRGETGRICQKSSKVCLDVFYLVLEPNEGDRFIRKTGVPSRPGDDAGKSVLPDPQLAE